MPAFLSRTSCSTLKFSRGAEVPGFDPLRYFDEKTAEQLDRSVQFAGAAAAEAIADSGITFVPERTAVITGCALGGKPTRCRAATRWPARPIEAFGTGRQGVSRSWP